MLPEDRLQTNRFEHKYLITAQQAAAVRDYVRGLLTPDSYMHPSQPDGYMVYSVYLDSPGMTLCKATMNGEKNRFKLRVRYYEGGAASPVFFEIKRRVNDAILKSRASVHRRAGAQILDGAGPSVDALTKAGSAKCLASLATFCQLRDNLGARPMTIVAYRREAYMSFGDNSARLTLDRQLRGCNWTGDLSDIGGDHWRTTEVEGVILELKFTQRYPLWMSELVRKFELQRQSVPKYVECVQALRDPRLTRVGRLGKLATFAE